MARAMALMMESAIVARSEGREKSSKEGQKEERLQPVYTDSGANTTVLGPNWHIISESMDRKITIYGFHDKIREVNLPMVNAISKIRIDGSPVLVQVNKGYD